MSRSLLVRSDAHVDRGADLHFDRASQITLAKRYAAAAMTLVYAGGATGMGDAPEPASSHGSLGASAGTPLFHRKQDPAGGYSFSDALGRYPGGTGNHLP